MSNIIKAEDVLYRRKMKMLMLMKWGFCIAWLKNDFLIFVIMNDDTDVGNIGTHVPDLDVTIPFNNALDTV